MYPIDPFEGNDQFLTKKRESTGLKHFDNSKAFIEYSNDMDEELENTTQIKNVKYSLFFHDNKIADMLSNKQLNPIVIESFTRGRKNISLVFIT